MWYRFVKTPENELNHARKIHLGKLRYRDFKEDADQHPGTKFFADVHALLSVLQTHVDQLANLIVKAKKYCHLLNDSNRRAFPICKPEEQLNYY